MGRGMAGAEAADKRHTYGYRRASILAALANAGLLLVAVGGIVVEAQSTWSGAGQVAGLTVVWSPRLASPSTTSCAAVHARSPQRPQYS